jgi:hypothetical protein
VIYSPSFNVGFLGLLGWLPICAAEIIQGRGA